MVFFVSGCTSEDQSQKKATINFLAQITTNSNNEVEISLQLISPDHDFDADPEFNAKMQLFEENNELRAQADMPQNPFMKKGELYQLITWRGILEPGSYCLEWNAPEYGGTINTFEVKILDSGLISIDEQTIKPYSN